MAQLRRKGDYGKRPRKTEEIAPGVEKEIGTDVILKNGEKLDTLGTNLKSTICSNSPSGCLFSMQLLDEDTIARTAFGTEFYAQYQLYKDNKQDFIDDAFLGSLEIVFKRDLAKKWGFNSGEDKQWDGKSRLNKVYKRMETASGGRSNFSTPKIRSKGAQHYTGKFKHNAEQIDRQQMDIVKSLPNNDNRRKIFIYSSWLDDLVLDIKSIESRYEYTDKHGVLKVNRKKAKESLYELLEYEKYKNHKEKIKEVISMYKTDSRKPMILMKG